MIILYFTILICISVLIFNAQPHRLKNVIIFVAIFLSILAFFQEVSKESDLNTAFYHLDKIRQLGWNYFNTNDIHESMYFSGRDALKVYFYILSIFPYNNFYSSISIFFIYYLPLKSTLTVCSFYRTPIKTTRYLLILLIWMIDFYDASNGVRNMLSFSIFIYALIQDLYSATKQKKILSGGLYLISALIHSSAWVLILLRLLLFIKNKRLYIIIGVVLITWSYSLEYLVPILQNINGSISGALEHQLNAYTHNNNMSATGNFDTSGFNNQASYLLMRLFRIIHISLFIYMFYLLWKRANKLSPLPIFVFLLSAFCIGSTSSNIANNVLTRYSFAIIFLTPIFYAYYNAMPIRKKELIGIERFALGLIIVALLFNYYMFRYHYHYMYFNL